MDAEIDINFMDLEHIEKPEFLQKYLHEKELLSMARKEVGELHILIFWFQVLSSPPGVYRIPFYARAWEKPDVPRKWRSDTTITPDILEVEPDLIKDIELQSIISDYLRKQPSEDEDDPIAQAAEASKQENGSPEMKYGPKSPSSEPRDA